MAITFSLTPTRIYLLCSTHLRYSSTIADRAWCEWPNICIKRDWLGGHVCSVLQGNIQHVNTDRANTNLASLGACFAPDSSSVISACGNNDLLIWDYTAGRKSYLSAHVATPTCVAANPKYDMMASACSNVLLWIPA